MTREQKEKIALGAGVIGLGLYVWYLWPKSALATSAGVPRKSSELVIDADVYSPTFGEPLYGPPKPAPAITPADTAGAISPEMRDLINRSSAAIAADDQG